MQSVVVATVAQPAPAAAGSAQPAAGDASASAPAAGASGFAALLAAQMLGAGDAAPVSVGGDAPGATPLGGSGKSKTPLADTPTDPALAAMTLVPVALATTVATPQATPVKTDSAAVSGANGAALQLVALAADAKTNPPTAAKVPGDGFAALQASLSGKVPANPGGATADAATAVAVDPSAALGDGAKAAQKVAEIAVGGNALPVAGDAKSGDARSASAALSNAPQGPDSSSIGTLQAGMVSTQGAQANDPGQKIQTPVGSPGWGDALGQKVVWMASGQQQTAELHLNPPNLGPMEVRLTVNNDQVSAVFVSHQPAVREAIEAAMPRLREMFAASGMTLGNAMVSSDSLPQQQQQSGQQGQSSSGRQSSFDGSFAADGSVSGTIRGVISLPGGGRGAVDLFA